MAYEFRLPDIGEGVVEGEVVRWLIKEGETLAQDQPMVEIMTDKATVEIPSPRPGKVVRRGFAEGELCPVGAVLIEIEVTGGGPQTAPAAGHGPPKGVERVARAVPDVARAVAAASGPVLATPATRKLAREAGVDLAGVVATGSNGRITSDDVRAAQSAMGATPAHPSGAETTGEFETSPSTSPRGRTVPAPVTAGPDVRVPFRGLRRKIAERMTLAKQKAAHFTYVEEVDASSLVVLREKANARYAADGLKISFLPFITRAVVDGLRRFPRLNSTLDETAGELVERRAYHIGIASATDDGLVVPVVKHADQLSLVDLSREIDRLAQAARGGQATREELSGSTFTITSLGVLGGLLATPIINFPEVAILGVHKIAKRPVVIGDKIEIRSMMNLSISVDHRLVDGHEAAGFVAFVKESLETPGLLFLESV